VLVQLVLVAMAKEVGSFSAVFVGGYMIRREAVAKTIVRVGDARFHKELALELHVLSSYQMPAIFRRNLQPGPNIFWQAIYIMSSFGF